MTATKALALSNHSSSIANVGKLIFRIVLGSATLSPPDNNYGFALLDEFVELGGNAFETAHSYGDGDCERVIGQWMRQRKNREKVVIITKGGHPFDGRSRVRAACVDADLEESLRRLQTDYIDVYLLHRDDPTRPADEIVECLNEHYKQGRIRAFGGSNWTPERIDAANQYAGNHGLEPFRVSSPNFSLALPTAPPWPGCLSATSETLGWYETTEVKMLSWSSQARGFFTERYSVDKPDECGVVHEWFTDANYERLRRAKILAQQKSVSANAIALAYVLAQTFEPLAAVGPRTVDELRDSFAALKSDLSTDDLKWLNLESD